MDTPMTTAPLYGLMAEFDGPNELVRAAKQTYAAGYRNIDAFSPFPIEEAWEAIGHHDRRLSFIVLCGGIVGLLSGIGLQEWVHTLAYPMNVAGKPLNSWPQFIPVTFELTILFASLSAVIGMIVLNGLPMPYHPVFNVPRFELASRDKFFLLVEATDPKFDRQQTLEFLKGLDASEINEVEP
jgi:Protein of unknown function (DUF3341)